MKEIKFRAWDGKLMLPVENICFDTKTVEVLIPCDAVGCEGHPIEYDFGNVALMQYTGLKDSDGKEIYDGDILEVKDSNGVICRTAVTQIEGAFVIGKWYPQTPISVGEQVEVDIEDHEFLGVVLKHHLEFMVVGNIFEHPHLLEANGNE